MSRLGSLPLAHHPGETFIYHTPRVVQGDKETALGYEFELNTYRNVLCPGDATVGLDY
jgi:hypothetical protein